MSGKPFTSKEMLQRLRQVPELAYEFDANELRKYCELFLQNMGYHLESPLDINSTPPDFVASRQTEKVTYRIVGMVAQRLDEVANKFEKLIELETTFGSVADYVVVLPPVSERPLIEFLSRDEGEWYHRFKTEQFMAWLCNPEKETMWCILGSPQDKLFDSYFAFPNASFDIMIGMKLSQEFPEE